MRRVFGPRTFVEAAFVVAVPFTAAVLGAGAWTIIGASAVGYLLIFVFEAVISREGTPTPGLSRLRMPARNVRVQRPEPAEAAVADTSTPVPEPEAVVVVQPVVPVVEPVVVPAPVPVSVPVEDRAHDHVRVLPPTPEPQPEPPAPAPAPEPAPEPTPEPAPEPVVERVPLIAVPELAPEPAPPLVMPAAAPEPQTVVPIGVSSVPRQWNLWDLERLTRESSGDDVVRDEERQFLLLYLREFADANGMLPVDFDGLVRDSFGELVGAR
jgi:hypothetical protein